MENSLLPDSTMWRSPPEKTVWNEGSCSTSAGMVTVVPSAVSRSVPWSMAARAARAMAPRARASTRWRFSRFLPCGLERRSMMSKIARSQADCLTRMYHSTRRRTWRSV